MIRRTPWVPHAVPVRASYEPHKGIFNVFHILRDPQGCRAKPLRTRKGIYTTGTDKNSARASYLAVRAPCGPRTGCLGYQNPFGARKLIMHTLKLYGSRTGRQNSYGAARGPCGTREWTYDFCSKQPGNSPYGAGSVM